MSAFADFLALLLAERHFVERVCRPRRGQHSLHEQRKKVSKLVQMHTKFHRLYPGSGTADVITSTSDGMSGQGCVAHSMACRCMTVPLWSTVLRPIFVTRFWCEDL